MKTKIENSFSLLEIGLCAVSLLFCILAATDTLQLSQKPGDSVIALHNYKFNTSVVLSFKYNPKSIIFDVQATESGCSAALLNLFNQKCNLFGNCKGRFNLGRDESSLEIYSIDPKACSMYSGFIRFPNTESYTISRPLLL